VRVAVSDRPMGEYDVFKTLTVAVAASSALTAALAFFLRLLNMPI